MRMFKHCINQFEECVIYDLIDTPHKLRLVCGVMGIILNLFMHLCYNDLNDVLTQWITPPWFGTFYIGKIPIWVYCLIVIIGYCMGHGLAHWCNIVHIDIYYNGRKRWCEGRYKKIPTYEYLGEQKHED
jgi:hypothetical protein